MEDVETDADLQPVKAKATKKQVKPEATKTPRKKTKKKAGDRHFGRQFRERQFPKQTLEEAIAVAKAIQEGNNGQPWATHEIAKSLGISRSTVPFYYLTKAAKDYGLTTAGRDRPQIGLTELGRDIVLPETSEQKREKLVEAFFNVPLFKQVYENFQGGALPDKEFLKGTLIKKFNLDESFHDEFASVYKANCRFIGLDGGSRSFGVLSEDKRGDATPFTVVGQTKGGYENTAFIIMPFTEKGIEKRPAKFFDEVLSSLITPACNSANFSIATAKSHGSDLIHHRIIKQLIEADLVIADLTDHNPNVLFELGIRLALDQKPVCLIRAKGTGQVFDVDNLMRVLDYSPELWNTTLAKDIPALTDHIKGAWENRATNPTYMKILTGQVATSLA